MKTLLAFGIVILPLFAPHAWAAIIGPNNMIRYDQLNRFNVAELAKATATKINVELLEKMDEESSRYPAGKLNGFCPDEPLAGRRTLGGCSGFLISPDTLATAGHCLKDCASEAWVFNHTDEVEGDRYNLSNRNIYRCKERLDFKHGEGDDYALVRLDRPVSGAQPFELNLKDDVEKGDPLAVLGYPLGLAFTYTPGGSVLGLSKTHITADLDVFKNNSGSVVMNLRTGFAEGILTNAEEGLSLNSPDGCREARHFVSGQVLINRLSRIPYLRNQRHFLPKLKTYELKNLCDVSVEAIVKFRSPSDGSFKTEIAQLAPAETMKVATKYTAIYVYAKSKNGAPLVSGKDFYGFKNIDRKEEYGFKKIDTEDIAFCR